MSDISKTLSLNINVYTRARLTEELCDGSEINLIFNIEKEV